jgi:uncharacterized repeat protein (TIGR03987 family)
MSPLLIVSISTTFLALIFYTIGVWTVRFSKELKPAHLIEFWIGLVFDIAGTVCMNLLAGSIKLDVHGLAGFIALALMLVNTIRVTMLWKNKQQQAFAGFRNFALIVWIVWLIPFFSGAIMHMK